jgi:hypothetical protein
MRLNDRRDGSIKALLILGLIIANIAVASSHRRADAQLPGSAGASPAVSRASRDTFLARGRLFREAQKSAGEGARAPQTETNREVTPPVQAKP